METSKDPLTGETFFKKRSNQIFANPENQIKFNNLKALKKRKEDLNTNRIINKNKLILKTILGDEEEAIKSLDFLLGAGLDFGYNTHSIIKDNVKWICVFNYAYSLIAPRMFKIIKL